jgi:hypothetical protein
MKTYLKNRAKLLSSVEIRVSICLDFEASANSGDYSIFLMLSRQTPLRYSHAAAIPEISSTFEA